HYRPLKVLISQLSSQFFSLCFFKLGNASHRFWTQDVTTPGHTSYLIISVIVVGLDSLHQLCKGTLILPVGDSCISLEHQFHVFYVFCLGIKQFIIPTSFLSVTKS
uniref:Uncharacterized protein n=1 Tax=Meleagris gallopavo TaxID=9103 RepID=A0A803YG08_MELGA